MSGGARVSIHPSAVVSAEAELGEGVEIGPLCVVGAGVRLGPGCKLLGSCTVLGPSVFGAENVIHPYAVLGNEPQDRSYKGEPTLLLVGDRNIFREHVTAHRGTRKDRGETRVGSGGLFMAGTHIAHDCVIGDGVTLANNTLLGGHVRIEDHAVTGGHVAIQPFVRVGSTAFLAGGAMVERDVPPFVVAAGDRAKIRALNVVGLRRRGVSEQGLRALREAFSIVFRSALPRAQAIGALPPALLEDPLVQAQIQFLRAMT